MRQVIIFIQNSVFTGGLIKHLTVFFWYKKHKKSIAFSVFFLYKSTREVSFFSVLAHKTKYTFPMIALATRRRGSGEGSTLRKLYLHFLSHWMGYDRGNSFPFDFEPTGIQFGSKSKGKLSPRSYPIQCERKWKYSFLSVELNVFKRNTDS